MDIENNQHLKIFPKDPKVNDIIKQVQKKSMNMNKVIRMTKGIKEKDDIFKQLVNFIQVAEDLNTKINILNFCMQVYVIGEYSKEKIFECYQWIINQIYSIRQNLDIDNYQTSQKLASMNNLLKMLYSILNKCNGLFREELEQTYMVDNIKLFLHSAEQTKNYESLANVIFSLNVLSKIYSQYQVLQYHHYQLVKKYFLKLSSLFPSQQKLQQMVISVMSKWITRIPELKLLYSQIIRSSSFSTQLTALNKIQLEQYLLEILDRYECEKQEQLELIGCLLQKYFSSCSTILREKLSQFWVGNCYHMMDVKGITNISYYVSDFTEQVLINLVRLLNSQFNKQLMNANRTILLVIWRFLLIQSKLKQYLVHHKTQFISIQLLIYKFVRQALEITQIYSLNSNQRFIILEIYSHYYDCMMQQPECKQIRIQAVQIYMQNYHQMLKPVMFLRKNVHLNTNQQTNVIDLNKYDNQMLQKFLKISNKRGTSLFGSLSHLNNKLGILLAKYLCLNNIFNILNCFTSSQLFVYLLEHNIEIHTDKLDHLLYQNISNNLQKTISLLRNFKGQNIYEKRVNRYIIDIIKNQTINSTKVKILPINFKTIIYIIQKFDDLLKLVQQTDSSFDKFIESLYRVISRGLFCHIPDAIFMLLLTIISNKSKIKEVQFSQKELILVNHLMQYCNQSEGHYSYMLVSYALILLIAYGDSFTNSNSIISNQIQKIMIENGYFLSKIIQIISKQMIIKQISLGFQRKQDEINKQIYENFWSVFRKIFLFTLIKHIIFITSNNQNVLFHQIFTIRDYIHKWVQRQTINMSLDSNHQSLNKTRKRQLVMQQMQNQQILRQDINKQSVQRKVNQQKIQTKNCMDLLIQRYQDFDEFKYLKQMEVYLNFNSNISMSTSTTIINNLLRIQRVHGKARTIIHVKK